MSRVAFLAIVSLAACSPSTTLTLPPPAANTLTPPAPTAQATSTGDVGPVATSTPSPVPAVSTPGTTPTALASGGLALPPADEASVRLSVPSGFAIRIFADGLPGGPRFMVFGPDNALYVSLTDSGEIVRLPDTNTDSLADTMQLAAVGLNAPHGLAWKDGWLYVAENDRVERLRSSQGDGNLDQIELVTDNIPGGSGHFTRTVHFGPDEKMYVSTGSSCNVCAENDPRRAAILRFNQDGSIPADNPLANDPDLRRRPLWAWGLRNSVDFLWTASGEMWASMMGRDDLMDASGLPDNLPPEVIVTQIQGGHSYGWPYCYNPVMGSNSQGKNQITDPQSRLRLPSGFDCKQAVPALFTDLPHSAPLGMSLASGANFPQAYKSDLFVAYHGSWNIQDPNNIRDCKVERIVIENGKPVRSETFIGGWRAPGQTCGSDQTYGRPADVIFGPDGAMYISDDAGGRVYRVIYVS